MDLLNGERHIMSDLKSGRCAYCRHAHRNFRAVHESPSDVYWQRRRSVLLVISSIALFNWASLIDSVTPLAM